MNKRILLVENAQLTRWLFQEFLEREGYAVCSLSENSAFFQAIAHFQPDLIILNVNRETDGFALLHQLHRSSYYCLIPAIVISNFRLDQEQQKTLLSEGYIHITKPVILEELTQVIKAEIERFAHSTVPTHIQFQKDLMEIREAQISHTSCDIENRALNFYIPRNT